MTQPTFTIHNGNCIEVMRTMADNSVDSIVTDPPYELGFMGKSWDSTGIAFNVEVWTEALRVLKPGGHLLAFSGSRTYHRMAVAIEDAGFQIRDQIMWLYGSGFPKSMSLSKTIDKTLGAPVKVGTAFNVAGEYGNRNLRNPNVERDNHHHEPITDEAKQWAGWGTALKPAHEPIVMARKPVERTIVNNVLVHGVGAVNVDDCRVETTDNFGGGTKGTSGFAQGYEHDGWVAGSSLGRFPANFIHDGSEEVVELIGDAARFFYCAKASKAERNAGLEDMPTRRASAMGYERGLGDAGEGMFKDRNPQKQNFHPTVKPIALMRYLVRLVTPPNGVVLDPFAGSGTTLVAAILEGFNPVGMEMTADYLPIINARVEWAMAQPKQTEPPTLF